jgi:hypothetical protein
MKGRFESLSVSPRAASWPAELQRVVGQVSGDKITDLTRPTYSSRGTQRKITPPFSYRDFLIEQKQVAIIRDHSALFGRKNIRAANPS